MLNSPKIPLFYRSPNLNECVIAKYLYNKDNMTYDKTMSRGSLKYFILKKGGQLLLLMGGFSYGGNSHIFGGQQSGGNWSKVRGAFVKRGDRRRPIPDLL
jgi:hypothetical protein